MLNLKEFVAVVQSLELKSAGNKINQIQRNQLKENSLVALANDLSDLNVFRTNDGIIVEIANDELGAIHLEIDIKVKNLDFDLDSAVAEREQTLANRAERAQKAAERKAKVAAEKAAKSAKTE
jgi:hypothetical protein